MKQKHTISKKNTTFKEQLSKCNPKDFDGHTDFDIFTPEQRLEWLAQLVQFTYEHKNIASKI
jgi:hypothetical protein